MLVDGGTEAWFRPDAWPRSSGPRGVLTYARRAKEWQATADRFLARPERRETDRCEPPVPI